eukprot:scaffold48795_cov18-Tisochrysis_lutea.AAC.1
MAALLAAVAVRLQTAQARVHRTLCPSPPQPPTQALCVRGACRQGCAKGGTCAFQTNRWVLKQGTSIRGWQRRWCLGTEGWKEAWQGGRGQGWGKGRDSLGLAVSICTCAAHFQFLQENEKCMAYNVCCMEMASPSRVAWTELDMRSGKERRLNRGEMEAGTGWCQRKVLFEFSSCFVPSAGLCQMCVDMFSLFLLLLLLVVVVVAVLLLRVAPFCLLGHDFKESFST